MTNPISAINSVSPTSNSEILTVIVLDDKSQPSQGAHVSITPSNDSGVTNNAGEIQFHLGTSVKYDITASYGNNTVTVPYYVTKNGTTRLVVNPVYVKTIEKQQHPQSIFSGVPATIGIGIVIIIVAYILWRIIRRKK